MLSLRSSEPNAVQQPPAVTRDAPFALPLLYCCRASGTPATKSSSRWCCLVRRATGLASLQSSQQRTIAPSFTPCLSRLYFPFPSLCFTLHQALSLSKTSSFSKAGCKLSVCLPHTDGLAHPKTTTTDEEHDWTWLPLPLSLLPHGTKPQL